MSLDNSKVSSKAFNEVLACAATRSNNQSKICNMQAITRVKVIVHWY